MKNYIGMYVQIMFRSTEQVTSYYIGKVKEQFEDSLVLEPFESDDSWVDWSKLPEQSKQVVLMYKVKQEVEVFIKNIVSISLLPKSGGYL